MKNYNQGFYCELELPPESCTGVYPPPTPTPPPATMVSDEICGNINQLCDGVPVEYWKAMLVDEMVSGSISVFNRSGCIITVRARTGGGNLTTLFTIERSGQTKSASLGAFSSLEISCSGGESQICTGSYCINVHYPKGC
ncbi:S-Ena type endospore appendage [Bacillus sp. P14.5]|uniref:S-Ena type endospore appendage n=1 Tax=Bacillus sp. P14.5 TaxID=1983400 RepID=UPI000DEBC3BD|nr:S-Ena type endospore appendage [Bacillus sp. P14.5]